MANALLPSKNVTVPVAVDGETVAVKITVCPNVDGFGLDVRVVVVGVLLTACIRLAETCTWSPAARAAASGVSRSPRNGWVARTKASGWARFKGSWIQRK